MTEVPDPPAKRRPARRYYWSHHVVKAYPYLVQDRRLNVWVAACQYRENADLVVRALNLQEKANAEYSTVEYQPAYLDETGFHSAQRSITPRRRKRADRGPDGDGQDAQPGDDRG